jgi:hypothetical protein
MNAGREIRSLTPSSDRLDQIELRLSRLEQQLQLVAVPGQDATAEGGLEVAPATDDESASLNGAVSEQDLEQVVGQQWFAHVGILVLALGAAFALSLPYPGAPPALPSILGYATAGGLFVLARVWREVFQLISSYLRGAAMALLYFSTLRLYYFGTTPVLTTDTWIGKALLLAVMVLNLVLALRRSSAYLMALALAMGYFTVVLLESPWLACLGITALSALVVDCWRRHGWAGLLLVSIPVTYLSHFVWMLDGSLWNGAFQPIPEPYWSVFFILLYGIVLGVAPLLRPSSEAEDSLDAACALFNAGAGYGLFLLHTALAFKPAMIGSQLVAAAVFLSLAVVLWSIRRSEIACFIYAMTGYLALSVAILSAFAVPNVFVWLSLQSVLVVTTALWFRSPFIVVANFFIYVAIVIGYMSVAREETGISLGFGLVALVSARILNWQKERLQLKTEKMRNAYLLSALLVFPYALYHLLPKAYVALSWVGVAGMYYLLNLLVRNQKYRWMGHFTLLLTVLYLLVVGIIQLAPTQRVVSFLVLGIVLVSVSLLFTRSRTSKRGVPPTS